MGNKELKKVLSGFLISYAERDKEMDFSGWLSDRIQQEIPDISKEAGEKLASEIIEAVDGYDMALYKLDSAIADGKSKEEWFAEHMDESYADMVPNDAGEKLQQIESALDESNSQLIQKISGDQIFSGEKNNIDVTDVEWNKYSIKDKVYKIADQISLSGKAVVANVIKNSIQSTRTNDISEHVKKSIQDSVKNDAKEVKAAVAGAVKVAAIKHPEDGFSNDVPTETICDMAGVAVESARALAEVANGGNVLDAIDKVGRAAIAAGCRFCSNTLKKGLKVIPFVGSTLADMLSGLTDHMASPKFSENVYNTVRDAAVATWDGIKKAGTKIGKKIFTSLFG